ncbi:unnamed protein product [Brachionus calyciflorus]|uniref:Uncharacterized protein n=1 Tax=Brachionus calyciflorus TaxID=104777 RepID=A0A814QSH7_9BILA|nr:unnamed protein product [Brachionus calyciflorus]
MPSDLLNYGEDAKSSYLQSSLFFKDDPGHMDSIFPNGDTNNVTLSNNTGLNKRRKFLVDSKGNLELISKIYCDIFNTEKLLLNGIDISLKIIRNENTFCLMHSPNKKFSIRINEVENTSHTGDSTKNPFNFQNFNLTSLDVKIDGQSITYASEIKLNFDNNNYLRAYNSLFENIDRQLFITGNNISREDFKNGYCLFAYDLSPDLCSGEHFNLIKTGNLSIHLTFKTGPNIPLQLVLYQEFDSVIEINQNRVVTSDIILKRILSN